MKAVLRIVSTGRPWDVWVVAVLAPLTTGGDAWQLHSGVVCPGSGRDVQAVLLAEDAAGGALELGDQAPPNILRLLAGVADRRPWVNRSCYLRALVARDGPRCCWCGEDTTPGVSGPRQATIEHLLPRSKGGALVPGNLAVACYGCNNGRGDADRPPSRELCDA